MGIKNKHNTDTAIYAIYTWWSKKQTLGIHAVTQVV